MQQYFCYKVFTYSPITKRAPSVPRNCKMYYLYRSFLLLILIFCRVFTYAEGSFSSTGAVQLIITTRTIPDAIAFPFWTVSLEASNTADRFPAFLRNIRVIRDALEVVAPDLDDAVVSIVSLIAVNISKVSTRSLFRDLGSCSRCVRVL